MTLAMDPCGRLAGRFLRPSGDRPALHARWHYLGLDVWGRLRTSCGRRARWGFQLDTVQPGRLCETCRRVAAGVITHPEAGTR
jgi:hypothetical protein